MVIQETTRGEATVLSMSGRLDFNARHAFQAAIQKAQAAGPRQIVLDFKEVPFVDSAALGLLTVAYKNLDKEKVQVAVANPQEYVKKVFELANLESIVPTFATVEEAVSARAQTVGTTLRK